MIALSKAGIQCLWVRPEFIDIGPRYGESLSPHANPILEQLDLEFLLDSAHHRHSNSTFSAWGSDVLIEKNSAIHVDGAGFVLNRSHFERGMFAVASEVATELAVGMLKTSAPCNRGWKLCVEELGEFEIEFLVDATGRAQKIGRDLAGSDHDDHLVAAYWFLSQVDRSSVDPTPATVIETSENGWWYAAFLPNGQLSVNYYSDPDLIPTGLLRNKEVWRDLVGSTKYVSRWIADAEFVLTQPSGMTSAATRSLRTSAGLSEQAPWAAVGDASISFDPLSGHGMTSALWAASRMPTIVSRSLKGDHQLLHEYDQSVAKAKQQFLQQRKHLYSQERRFKDSRFWQRRQF